MKPVPIEDVRVKPVLFVTGHLPAYRAGALCRLHEREGIELALFGGRSAHGGAEFTGRLPFEQHRLRPIELGALAASGRYRAVVCPTGGRLAPAATWAGTRRAGVPLILWASLWAHPRSVAHAATYLAVRRLYRSADAVVTYGPHVSDYVRARGAANVHVAPQSVDNDFWASGQVEPPSDPSWPSGPGARFVFVGRPAREKGLTVLLDAWRAAGLAPEQATLVLVGVPRPERNSVGAWPGGEPGTRTGIVHMGAVGPAELRNIYAAADALVLPSIPTRTFREPWGLVVNEAMNRSLPVIVTDAVGAAAGGLVRNGRNGLVVPAADAAALGRAVAELAADPALRGRLGEAGAHDVRAYSHEAWAEGFSRALATVGVSRERW